MGGQMWGKKIKEAFLRKGRDQRKGERLPRKTDTGVRMCKHVYQFGET